MNARIEHTVTSGTFSLDGRTFEVDNNVWVIGDDRECVVVDAPHDVDAILELVRGRDVLAVTATHGHDDHVRCAPELADRVRAPVLLHPDDLVLWRMTHPEREPDRMLVDREVIGVAGIGLQVLHTPGHAPGAVCLYAVDLGTVFSGDTLFAGGPGATGPSYSDFDVIIESISERLFTLPPATLVHPGHGPSITVEEVRPQLQSWIERGY